MSEQLLVLLTSYERLFLSGYNVQAGPRALFVNKGDKINMYNWGCTEEILICQLASTCLLFEHMFV